MKLLIVESHPVQYHAPVYRRLVELAGNAHEVKVIYATGGADGGRFDVGFGRTVQWDQPLLDGYQSIVLSNERGVPLQGFFSLKGTGLLSLLIREQPDAVLLVGLNYEYYLAAFAVAKALRIPVWLRQETQDVAFSRSLPKALVRSTVYKTIYQFLDIAFYIGELNRLHYVRMAPRRTRMVFSPYCTVDRFSTVSKEVRAQMRIDTRAALNIPFDDKVILFCGKLQAKKQPEFLLEAVPLMQAGHLENLTVLYVGAGDDEDKLQAMAAVAPFRVRFAGFKNQSELPAYYFSSDVLVLPSRQLGETWGLVVNEALQAGCKGVVSQYVGCAPDLKYSGNLEVYDGTREDFVRCLERAITQATVDCSAFMSRYSVDAAARGILEAFHL